MEYIYKTDRKGSTCTSPRLWPILKFWTDGPIFYYNIHLRSVLVRWKLPRRQIELVNSSQWNEIACMKRFTKIHIAVNVRTSRETYSCNVHNTPQVQAAGKQNGARSSMSLRKCGHADFPKKNYINRTPYDTKLEEEAHVYTILISFMYTKYIFYYYYYTVIYFNI